MHNLIHEIMGVFIPVSCTVRCRGGSASLSQHSTFSRPNKMAGGSGSGYETTQNMDNHYTEDG